jgi:hypothetical protein
VVRRPQFGKRCSTCFGHRASVFRRHYTSSFWCELRALVAVGWFKLVTTQQIQVHATHTKNCSVVPPEDRRSTPETCRGLRHNKVFVKVKVYEVGYAIVIHDTGQQIIKYIGIIYILCPTWHL